MVYGTTFFSRNFEILRDKGGLELVISGSFAAFFGAFIGSRLIEKVTMHAIQSTVGVMLLVLAIALGAGLV